MFARIQAFVVCPICNTHHCNERMTVTTHALSPLLPSNINLMRTPFPHCRRTRNDMGVLLFAMEAEARQAWLSSGTVRQPRACELNTKRNQFSDCTYNLFGYAYNSCSMSVCLNACTSVSVLCVLYCIIHTVLVVVVRLQLLLQI